MKRLLGIVVGIAAVLFIAMIGIALALPATRHLGFALLSSPERMPALDSNPLIHFEPGAEAYALAVADELPAAIARVEAMQGRPFAHPVPIGVYSTAAGFIAANPLLGGQPVGVTAWGRVILSPVLGGRQRQRLPAILTHELSHAHLQGLMGSTAYVRLPNWFKEGLAVMVSGGGGAELVSEADARAAILRGERIAVDDSGSPLSPAEIRYEKAPPADAAAPWRAVVLAYREAGMFVAWMRSTNEQGFNRMLAGLLDGRSFAEVVADTYGSDVRSLWGRFEKDQAEK